MKLKCLSHIGTGKISKKEEGELPTEFSDCIHFFDGTGDNPPNKEVIENIYDKRVLTLRDSFIFCKGNCANPESFLGKKWVEIDFDENGRAFALEDEVDQELVFDKKKGQVSLVTQMTTNMMGDVTNYDHEMILRRDGTVVNGRTVVS